MSHCTAYLISSSWYRLYLHNKSKTEKQQQQQKKTLVWLNLFISNENNTTSSRSLSVLGGILFSYILYEPKWQDRSKISALLLTTDDVLRSQNKHLTNAGVNSNYRSKDHLKNTPPPPTPHKKKTNKKKNKRTNMTLYRTPVYQISNPFVGHFLPQGCPLWLPMQFRFYWPSWISIGTILADFALQITPNIQVNCFSIKKYFQHGG